ncbi:sulfonate transport system substrate-binding protein [Kushneria avicenniae]|uniref:Putative aliphatic sulfonates-binding protein n=1 Tax=Kushneria avicenniae TaxID=402385 RepID=A0A1I1LH07_9GAMM|nr:aliphatic sulfonate ABC transporter substrate-binding protein [Kushneria avicenniae]SFC72255.1 sulfonate transport system substrate-binding protein [Kushneria avicenniae]
MNVADARACARSILPRPASRLLAGALISLLALTPLTTAAAPSGDQALPEDATTVRIGFQRSSTLMSLLRHDHTLENALAEQRVRVRWHEFASGLPMLEALNIGNIDVSADVADTVPIFAQAAGADLTFYAQEAPSPAGQALLVPADSDIHDLEDLRGKRIAVTRGAGNHYLLLAILKHAGLAPRDISIAYLPPSDARAAFTQGSVDGWIAWEPFLSTTRAQSDTRTLTDGRDGLASYTRYYLAASTFARQHPQVLNTIYHALEAAGEEVRQHPDQSAALLSPLWGNLPEEVVKQANSHRSYRIQPVEREGLEEQQRIADTFLDAGILPQRVDTQKVNLWQPDP